MSMKNFSSVSGYLASLPMNAEVRVLDLVNLILGITNHKKGTQNHFKIIIPYSRSSTHVDIADLWVDMSYQRRIRLKKLLEKIVANGGFDKSAAGTVDIAFRSNGKKYVWDGLRRCIMAGLCGSDFVECSVEDHTGKDMLPNEEKARESELFSIRNSQNENMTPDEIFKAHVVSEKPKALDQLRILKKCNLDVEGTNPTGVALSAFRAFDDEYSNFEESILEQSSKLIQRTFKDGNNKVTVYLLLGLSAFLAANDDVGSYNEEEILQAFKDFSKRGFLQRNLTQPRLSARPTASVAFNIARKVMVNENGLIKHLSNKLNLSDVDVDFLDNS